MSPSADTMATVWMPAYFSAALAGRARQSVTSAVATILSMRRYYSAMTIMATAAAAITAVESQPRMRKVGPAANAPIFLRLVATSIIATIIGTAIRPLTTALQNSA